MTYNSIHSCFGNKIKVDIFGGSHEPFVGTIITGLPAGVEVDLDEVRAFMALRAPGNSIFTTARKEPDIPEIKSGAFICGKQLTTDGTPLEIVIKNADTQPEDYKKFKTVPRPGHADFSAFMKYRASADGAGDRTDDSGPSLAGGGPFSARMTAPLCAAGAIAIQMLKKCRICIGSHIFSVGNIYDVPFEPARITNEQLLGLNFRTFPVINNAAGEKMKTAILKVKSAGDSLGGIIETAAAGLPAGLGGPLYSGVESVLSPILFGIPAVKGVEFGTGFAAATLIGSENNDPFMLEAGRVVTRTNHHGGILGGITTGMPLVVRIAFKPTPSIALEQDSVDLEKMEPAKISIKGRHDPCVAIRAFPAVEAAIALGIADLLL